MFDLVLKNGYLIDPINKKEGYYDVAINNSTVADIFPQRSNHKAKKIVNIEGLHLCPGLVDAHVHVTSKFAGPSGYKMIAKAGVTTAIDLAGPIEEVLETIGKYGSGINFGCCNAVMPDLLPNIVNPSKQEIEDFIDTSIERGAFGIKILGGHFPLSPDITRTIIEICNQKKILVAFHAGTTKTGSHLEGMREAIELAKGQRMLLVHINGYLRGLIKDPILELAEALELLRNNPNIFSGSFCAIVNGTSAKCINGVPASQVTCNCLKMRNYPATQEGLKEAILDGYARILKIELEKEDSVRIKGEKGVEYWLENKTITGLGFPVNLPDITFALACARNKDRSFVVDIITTDGGGIPRNFQLKKGLCLVKYNALNLQEFVYKVSSKPAQLLGLLNKGHLSQGADADITIFDLKEQEAIHSLIGGKFILKDKEVIGSGGSIIATSYGKEFLEKKGLLCTLSNMEDSKFYSKGDVLK